MKRAPGTGVPPVVLYISAEWNSHFGGGWFVKICWFAGIAAEFEFYTFLGTARSDRLSMCGVWNCRRR